MHDKRGIYDEVPQTDPPAQMGKQRRQTLSYQSSRMVLRARTVRFGDTFKSKVDSELALAFEHTPTAMALVNAEGQILAANRALHALVDLPRHEVVASSLAQLLETNDEGVIVDWPYGKPAKTPMQFERPLTTRAGRRTWVLVDVRLLPPQGRNSATALVTLHDITERKQQAERVAEMQATLDKAFDVGRAALWTWDLDTDELIIDDTIKASLGYQPDEVRRRVDWLTKLHPDDVAALTGLGETLMHNTPPSFEFVARVATKSGDFRSLLARGRAVRSPQGPVRRVVGLAVDISERKRAFEVLQESQQRFALAALAGRVSVYDYDLSTGAIYTDPTFTQLLGLGSSTALGHDTWLQRVHPDDREHILAREVAALQADAKTDANGNSPIPDDECRLIADNGEIIWLLLRGTVLRTVDGLPHRVIGTATDITRYRRAEDALRESEAHARLLTGRLLHAQDEERRRIARELHGVTAGDLSVLLMNLARLKQRIGEDEADKQVQILEESETLAKKALNEVRTLSYLLHPPLLDEAGLLPGLRWYIDGFRERSGIAVKLVAPARMARLSGDLETALFRVMQECLTNIHVHSGSKSARISLTKTATQVELRVSDRGHGMKDPETRLDAMATVGVGIAGMRQRLRQLGGSLQIHSTRRGTTVTASAPIMQL